MPMGPIARLCLFLLSLRIVTLSCKWISGKIQKAELIKTSIFILYTLASCCFHDYFPFSPLWLFNINHQLWWLFISIMVYFQEIMPWILGFIQGMSFKNVSLSTSEEFYSIVKSIIIVPICEEILFRGILYRLISELTCSPVIACFGAGLIFAVSHWDNTSSWPEFRCKFAYTFAFGVAAGFAYYASGRMRCWLLLFLDENILCCIILHSICNTWGLPLVLVQFLEWVYYYLLCVWGITFAFRHPVHCCSKRHV